MEKVQIGDLVRYEPECDTIIKLRANTTVALSHFKGIVTAKIQINDISYLAVEWLMAIDKFNNIENVSVSFMPKVIKEDDAVKERFENISVTTKNRAKIYFAKVRENAIIPTKRREDAGFDFYACFDEDAIVINSGETKMISTGIATACNEDYFFLAKERGSTGTKGMALRCGVIDSGYRNEWFICYTNTTAKPIVIVKEHVRDNYDKEEYLIYPYEKAIAQGILCFNIETENKEISYDELKAMYSERGLGNIGSSNK